MTVFDQDDGTQYTLNIPDRTIASSTGAVLDLTQEQTDSVAQAFYSTIATDPVANSLPSVAAGSDPNCPDPRPEGMCYQQTSRMLPPMMFSPREHLREVLKRRQAPSRRRIGMFANRVAYSHSPFFFAQYGGTNSNPCTNIANDIANKLNEHHSVRTKFIKEGFSMAVPEGVNMMHYIIPAGTSIGAAFNTLLIEHEAVMVNTGFIAWVWNSYNCGNRYVEVGPFFAAGNYSNPLSRVECEMTHFNVSVDDGNHWIGFWAELCHSTL